MKNPTISNAIHEYKIRNRLNTYAKKNRRKLKDGKILKCNNKNSSL